VEIVPVDHLGGAGRQSCAWVAAVDGGRGARGNGGGARGGAVQTVPLPAYPVPPRPKPLTPPPRLLRAQQAPHTAAQFDIGADLNFPPVRYFADFLTLFFNHGQADKEGRHLR